MNSQWHVYRHVAPADELSPGLPQATSLRDSLEKIENSMGHRIHTILYMGNNTFWVLARVEVGEQAVMDHALELVAGAKSEGKQAA